MIDNDEGGDGGGAVEIKKIRHVHHVACRFRKVASEKRSVSTRVGGQGFNSSIGACHSGVCHSGIRSCWRTALNAKEQDDVWNNRRTIVSYVENIVRLQQELISSLNWGAPTKE